MRSSLLALALAAGCAASTPAVTATPKPPAAKFEMHMYYLALLQRGPTYDPTESEETKHVFEGHMANIKRLAATGQLVIAGPFGEEANEHGPWEGIFIYDVATRAEAEQLVASDPAVHAGRLSAQILQWYGPKGLTYPGRALFVKAPGAPALPGATGN